MRTNYSMTSKEAFGEPYKSREDETRRATAKAGYPYVDVNLQQIALSLGRIADMLAEMNGYIIQYDVEKKEE